VALLSRVGVVIDQLKFPLASSCSVLVPDAFPANLVQVVPLPTIRSPFAAVVKNAPVT